MIDPSNDVPSPRHTAYRCRSLLFYLRPRQLVATLFCCFGYSCLLLETDWRFARYFTEEGRLMERLTAERCLSWSSRFGHTFSRLRRLHLKGLKSCGNHSKLALIASSPRSATTACVLIINWRTGRMVHLSDRVIRGSPSYRIESIMWACFRPLYGSSCEPSWACLTYLGLSDVRAFGFPRASIRCLLQCLAVILTSFLFFFAYS